MNFDRHAEIILARGCLAFMIAIGRGLVGLLLIGSILSEFRPTFNFSLNRSMMASILPDLINLKFFELIDGSPSILNNRGKFE